ncbi:MAG: hypothetical protein IK005_05910 [Paludibacteraceae bacterium]|nr:hypothetical protein [Paludibacteraceae bacterium]
MSILGFGSNKKEFMTFNVFDFKDGIPEIRTKEVYQVMINPEEFSKSMTANFTQEKAMTNSISAGRFANMQPIDYNFTLMIDGTGVIPTQKGTKSVQEQLTQLTKIFFKVVEGNVGYEPNFVAITYCSEVFYVVNTSFKIDYKLFKQDGSPLRAKVTCSFKSICMKPQEDKKIEKPEESELVVEKNSALDDFADAVSEAYDKALDSLFKLSV